MKLTTALSFLLVTNTSSFTPSHHHATPFRHTTTTTTTTTTTSTPSATTSATTLQAKKVLTPSDIISKHSSLSAEAEDEIPKLFSPEIYNDYQSILLKLEKRVKGGRGSLSLQEVEEMEGESCRILGEMSAYLKDPEGMKKKIAESYASSGQAQGSTSATVNSNPSGSTTHTIEATPPPQQAVSPPPQATVPPPQVTTPPPPPQAVTPPPPQAQPQPTDLSASDHPPFKGGYGLAAGTTNTYLIPGMESMSPQEYRDKLQASISERQAKRREEALKSGRIGNGSSNGYLEGLGKGEIFDDDELNVNESVDGDIDEKSGRWRSDSVRGWMEALERVEREIGEKVLVEDDSDDVDAVNLEATGVLHKPDASETDVTTNDHKLVHEQHEELVTSNNSPDQKKKQQQQKATQPLKTKDSFIQYATSLKQTKTEKELNRKSEWQEEKHWRTEKRQRPVPSSSAPEYEPVDRYIGDASRTSVSERKLQRGWYNEKRVRPVPSAESRPRPMVVDRTGAQPQRRSVNESEPEATSTEGVWYDEKRVRPVPNSESPERPTVVDRTGAQPQRRSVKESEPEPEGVWYDEKRVRPIPDAESEPRPTVVDRTGAQPQRRSVKESDPEASASEGVWYDEQRVRPIPSTESQPRPMVVDRTGVPQQQRRSVKESDPEPNATEEVWYDEKRVRPVPNSESPERPMVSDRTGAQQKRQSSKASSDSPPPADDSGIWYDEKRVRPIPNSDSPERPKVFDRTGAELKTNKPPVIRDEKAPNASYPDSDQPPEEGTWYNEKRVRPPPNTKLPNHPKVLDRTGSDLEHETTPKPPKRKSLLRSLLNEDPPNRTKTAVQTSSQASITSASSEISQWWNDNIKRPKDYAISSASLNNSYEEMPKHPKNYGDMKIELPELKDDRKKKKNSRI